MAHQAREAQQPVLLDQLPHLPEEALSPSWPAAAPPRGTGAPEAVAGEGSDAPISGELVGKVFAFAYRMLRDRAEAEDAAQETFLRALRSASSFEGRSARATWLLSIARNVCLDRLRGRKRASLASMERLIGEARDARADDGLSELERRSYVEAVREGCLLGTLASLSPDQRAAFLLRTVSSMDTAEAAAVLGKSENAVRVLTHRAVSSLKAFLCRNCSLYDPQNACRCENLVAFSLDRGWIGPRDRRLAPMDASAIAELVAASVDELSRLAALYSGLADRGPRAELASRIRISLRGLDEARERNPALSVK